MSQISGKTKVNFIIPREGGEEIEFDIKIILKFESDIAIELIKIGAGAR